MFYYAHVFEMTLVRILYLCCVDEVQLLILLNSTKK